MTHLFPQDAQQLLTDKLLPQTSSNCCFIISGRRSQYMSLEIRIVLHAHQKHLHLFKSHG